MGKNLKGNRFSIGQVGFSGYNYPKTILREVRVTEDTTAFDLAAEKALAELKEMTKTLTPEQLQGVLLLVAWWKKWFMQAGHKRLGRVVANFKVEAQ